MYKFYPNWPKPGDKLKFLGAGRYHFFTSVIEEGKKLKIGDVFTVKKCEPASSWCPIYFEETGDAILEASWFEPINK
jgi:hypothetical protein